MNSIDLAEPIVHQMFLDLTMSNVDKRLVYVIYKTTIASFPGGHQVKGDQSELNEEQKMEEEYSR